MLNKFLTILVLVGATFSLSACGVQQIDSGETGVKKTFGEVSKEVYGPGWHYFNPFISSMTVFDNKEKILKDKTEVYTKDVQEAVIEYSINFYLLPEKTAEIYSTVGYNYERVLIPQAITGNLKNVIGQWNAMDFVANRQKVAEQVKLEINKSLSRSGIVVTSFQITDDAFSANFEQAVEAKVTALQRAEEAKNTTIKVQEEANQRIISAKADAEAMKIQTQALEQSQALVLYEAVKRWDGVLPKIVSSGDSAGTMLNIPTEVLK